MSVSHARRRYPRGLSSVTLRLPFALRRVPLSTPSVLLINDRFGHFLPFALLLFRSLVLTKGERGASRRCCHKQTGSCRGIRHEPRQRSERAQQQRKKFLPLSNTKQQIIQRDGDPRQLRFDFSGNCFRATKRRLALQDAGEDYDFLLRGIESADPFDDAGRGGLIDAVVDVNDCTAPRAAGCTALHARGDRSVEGEPLINEPVPARGTHQLQSSHCPRVAKSPTRITRLRTRAKKYLACDTHWVTVGSPDGFGKAAIDSTHARRSRRGRRNPASNGSRWPDRRCSLRASSVCVARGDRSAAEVGSQEETLTNHSGARAASTAEPPTNRKGIPIWHVQK